MRQILASYPNAKQVVWLQEEPINMGPWRFVDAIMWRIKNDGYDWRCVARVESGSPATGGCSPTSPPRRGWCLGRPALAGRPAVKLNGPFSGAKPAWLARRRAGQSPNTGPTDANPADVSGTAQTAA